MATWFHIEFEGEPTEGDFARVSELAAQGFTSGQLINEPGAENEEGPATGLLSQEEFEFMSRTGETFASYRAKHNS